MNTLKELNDDMWKMELCNGPKINLTYKPRNAKIKHHYYNTSC